VSLINDALRKARQAAAEHEAQQPDATFRAPKAYPSRGPHRRSGVMMLAVVAVMAGLAGAAVAWWVVGQREQPVAAVVPMPTPSPTPIVEAPKAEAPAVVPVVPVASAEETAVVIVATPTPATPQVATALEPATAPTPQERTRAATNDRIFDLDADLGYATLSLGYIVARPDNPFAEINGVDVFVGSEVEGFRVEKIEADRVVLRDGKGELVLRVP
jgi:hypothetical protein